MQGPTKPEPPATGWNIALEKVPQFLSVLLIFTLPFLTQPGGISPLFPKFAVTQIIVFFILGAWAWRVFLTGKLVWVSSRAHWVLLVFMIWSLLSLAFSPFAKACLWKMQDDLVYPLWYVLLTFTCLEAWQAENLLVSFLMAGLGTSLWALGQVLGIWEGGWMEAVKNQFGGRPIAGMGSPDLLAGYLLMVWPLALALWMRADNKFSRCLWSFLSTASLFSLFLSGSPAGWLGLTVGTVLFSALTLKDRGLKGLKWFVFPAVLIAASFFIPPLSSNLREFLSPSGETAQVQEQVWEGTLALIQKRPIFGAGFGAFPIAFPPCRPPFLMLHYPQQVLDLEHASNWVLEWTAETGIVGLLLILAFWIYVLAQWWKLYAANAISKPLAAGVFAAVASVAADNLLDMNSYSTAIRIPLLFLAAFPVALSQRFYRMDGFPILRKELDVNRWKIYLLPVLVILAGLVFQRVGNAFQRQGADLDLKKASSLVELGKWDEALGLYDKALQLDPPNGAVRYLRGSAYLSRNHAGDPEKALDDLNEAEEVLPDYKLLHYQKYEVLLKLSWEKEAQAELRKAVRLDPTLVYLLEDFKEARTLASTGRLAEALIIYQNLYFDYPTCVPMMIDYANCFAMAGNGQSAVALYQQVLRFDPGNPKALHNLQKVWDVLHHLNQPESGGADVLGKELE